MTEILGTQVLQGKFNQKYPLAFEDDICYEKLIEPYLSPMLCHEINWHLIYQKELSLQEENQHGEAFDLLTEVGIFEDKLVLGWSSAL